MSALPPKADIGWRSCPLSAKGENQTDRLAHSPGKRPAELAGRFETRTAPMVTFGAGDTGAVVDLASG
jgi:hypothetical protein